MSVFPDDKETALLKEEIRQLNFLGLIVRHECAKIIEPPLPYSA